MLPEAYCPVCGTLNEPRMFYCRNCGTSLVPGGPAPKPGTAPAVPETAPSSVAPGPAEGPFPTAPPTVYREADFETIVGDTFVVFSRDWWAFWLPATVLQLFANVGLILFFAAPEQSFSSALTSPTLLSFSLANPLGLLLVELLISVVGGSILQATLCYYAVRKHRRQEVTFSAALARGVAKFFSVLLAAVLLVVLIFVLGFVVGLLFILSLIFVGIAGLCFGIVLIVLFVVGIVVIEVAVSLYVPIIVTENAGPVESLSRSWDLTKGHRWSLFGTYIFFGIIAVVLSFVVTFGLATMLSPIARVVVAAATSGLTSSIILVAQSVAYSLIASPDRALYWFRTSPYPSR